MTTLSINHDFNKSFSFFSSGIKKWLMKIHRVWLASHLPIMAKVVNENFQNWDVEDVSTWLGEIHLSNHIPAFERNQITGTRLAELSDKELREQLRVVKPSELMALKGAIAMLKKPQQSRTMSVVPNKRERTGSGGNAKQLQSPFDRTQTLPQMGSNWSTGLPRGVVERAVVVLPDLREGSAPQLLDDMCRYSGWIRKQGGGHKSCECSIVVCVCKDCCFNLISIQVCSVNQCSVYVATNWKWMFCSLYKLLYTMPIAYLLIVHTVYVFLAIFYKSLTTHASCLALTLTHMSAFGAPRLGFSVYLVQVCMFVYTVVTECCWLSVVLPTYQLVSWQFLVQCQLKTVLRLSTTCWLIVWGQWLFCVCVFSTNCSLVYETCFSTCTQTHTHLGVYLISNYCDTV